MSIRRSLMIAQFPGGGVTAWQTARYVARLVGQLESDPRINRIEMWDKADTPIPMVRNLCLLEAEAQGVDYVLMIDNDMVPDFQADKPFFQSSFDFMLAHDGPCVVAAPYCGPPPRECVYVFRWANFSSGSPDPDFAIEMYPREEAAGFTGIRPAAALPTGLILIDMRAVRMLPHPRFYYEWTDASESRKASTEDVTFTRDLSCLGVRIYCNWDAWAGHLKTKTVGKPEPLSPLAIPRLLRRTALAHNEAGTCPPPPAQRIRPHNRHGSVPAVYPRGMIREGHPVDPELDDAAPLDPEAEYTASVKEAKADAAFAPPHRNGELVT